MTALPLRTAQSVYFPLHRFSIVSLHVRNRLLISLPFYPATIHSRMIM